MKKKSNMEIISVGVEKQHKKKTKTKNVPKPFLTNVRLVTHTYRERSNYILSGWFFEKKKSDFNNNNNNKKINK